MVRFHSRKAQTPATPSARLGLVFGLLAIIISTQTDAVGQSLRSQPSGYAERSGSSSNSPTAGRGGAANADFDTLIDLIISTVAVDTWAENGGGEADIRPFAASGGVFVDSQGTLQRVKIDSIATDLDLLRQQHDPRSPAWNDPRGAAEMRFVSLPRLEQEIARCQREGQPLDESILTLAGLRRVKYVFLYPEENDVVLAGPADNWYVSDGGLLLSTNDDQPVVRLDDLLVLLRREYQSPGSYFGCSITPRQEALARTQAFLNQSAGRPLQPGQRKRWLQRLRAELGQQDIELFGVDPASRVARVLVEADYHMKLIGMGLEDGVAGVRSYLDTVRLEKGADSLPLAVLRWWFAMRYPALRTNADATGFEIVGQGVQVLSENEMLTQQGDRIHTGKSDPLTAQFAHSFTTQFELLCQKYPLYTELRNIFDLALVAALLRSPDVANQVQWQPDLLIDAQRLRLPESNVPRQVDTVINHRVVNRRHIVVGISGGVMAAPGKTLKLPRQVDAYGAIADGYLARPADLATGSWWWDAKAAAAQDE